MHNYESLHLILSRIIRTLTTIMIPGPDSATRTVLANGIFWSNFGWSLNLRFLTSAAYCSTSFCLIDLSCFTNQFFLLKKLDFGHVTFARTTNLKIQEIGLKQTGFGFICPTQSSVGGAWKPIENLIKSWPVWCDHQWQTEMCGSKPKGG